MHVAHEQRHGFPGMIENIDCTEWTWINCPVALKGQYISGLFSGKAPDVPFEWT